MTTLTAETRSSVSKRIGTLVVAASFVVAGHAAGQDSRSSVGALKIAVIEGEDAVNLIDKKTAVKPTVEVRDRNDLPVAGAVVRFAIRGRGAAFDNGVREVTVTTDSLGRATVGQLTPVGKGAVEIQVHASYQGQTAVAAIHQTNFATAAEAANATHAVSGASTAAGGSGGGLSGGAIAGIAGGAAAGAVAAVAIAKRGADAPVVSSVTASPTNGLQGATTITFTVQATDTGSNSLSYAWDFGDASTGTGQTVTHRYSTSGTFTVRATANNGSGSASGQTTVTIKSLTGQWRTFYPSINQNGANLFTLTQTGATITGTYSFTGTDGRPAGGPVSGTVQPNSPMVDFRVAVTNSGITYIPFRFTGDPTPDANSVSGALNESGYDNFPLTLIRQ